MRTLIGVAALAAAIAPILPEAPALSAKTAEPSLAEVKAITAKYRDIKVALAEGYVSPPGNMCETSAMMGLGDKGAMGIHYVRPDLIGISGPPSLRVNGNGTHIDFNKPAILIYEPQADGSLELVAVENLVFEKAWHAAGHKGRPTFHGQAFDRMADDPATPTDEAHNFEPHYDLHVWVHRENPNGVFAQFNPRVSCAHSGHEMSMKH